MDKQVLRKYDEEAAYGILHWPKKSRIFYKARHRMFKKKETEDKKLFSDRKIIQVVKVVPDTHQDYDFMEEIEVIRMIIKSTLSQKPITSL